MSHLQAIKANGYSIVSSPYGDAAIQEMVAVTAKGLAAGTTENIKTSLGETYAARNLVTLAPELIDLWKRPELVGLLHEVLGPKVGLVRVLYFDKHPSRTWTLPWHQDMTIAVKDNSLPTDQFCKPTNKSGVPHVEASNEVLAAMLTLRIHLDEVTDENGPLKVIRGSHAGGKLVGADSATVNQSHLIDTVYAAAGDVLAMRPLISHSSGASVAGTSRHRRILHLEFSGITDLPDGYEWFHYFPI